MIFRDRTAIRRTELSKPMRTALRDGVLNPAAEVFDYGCGFGDDMRYLEAVNIPAFGWDPAHRPDGTKRAADVVNLGYVINVIENAAERVDVLRDAWTQARRALIVSARLRNENDAQFIPYEDGYVTRLQTFQKFYDQQELRDWIAENLGEMPVAAAPGVFYVFRDPASREAFVASRYRRQLAIPRIRQSDRLFEEHRSMLDELMNFVIGRGRLPEPDEIGAGAELTAVFGSLKRAFLVVRRVTGDEQWDAIKHERRNDLLVYLALGRFPRRPPFSSLPIVLQRDIKALFSTYKGACEAGDDLLFSAGDMKKINESCSKAPFGKLMPSALYVHASGLDRLPGILRVYEGCARVLSGQVEGTTIVKLRRQEPKVSYLSYPQFDEDGHPSLTLSVRVDLRSFDLKYRNFSESADPPILHRKEEFVPEDYPLKDKFRRLTVAEEAAGLFEHSEEIGSRHRWNSRLQARNVRITGHHLELNS